MKADEILKILNTDGSLFNARYRKDADSAARHITEHYGPVTLEEVAAVMATQAIHPLTGNVMDPM